MRVVLHGQPSLVPLQRISSLDVHVRLSHLSRCRSLVFHSGRLWQTTTCADVVHRRCDTTKHRRHQSHSHETKRKKKKRKKGRGKSENRVFFLFLFGPRSQRGEVQPGPGTRPEGSFFSVGGILGEKGGRCALQVAWTQAWIGRRWNGCQLHLIVHPIDGTGVVGVGTMHSQCI